MRSLSKSRVFAIPLCSSPRSVISCVERGKVKQDEWNRRDAASVGKGKSCSRQVESFVEGRILTGHMSTSTSIFFVYVYEEENCLSEMPNGYSLNAWCGFWMVYLIGYIQARVLITHRKAID
ncbi:hypothetical protein ASPZODRAFT_1971655 [Penicilliopsis zonata CBS 506.65]|uniref:Uncharacterized protein n=1 Tax=Penicilliopsis zonata CBS 506.65 TaxID=1073090 RepID=A0A1L9SHH7_9EURO|nr:hypothetical protein ASPZODRAFT_1971655 [Penicilliopsis zonata CBS 506.65]OJJ46556.1 hypothetical protein ASPZODRAFT_1971655 [Penicilliopsis zonata CBS 506.65]